MEKTKYLTLEEELAYGEIIKSYRNNEHKYSQTEYNNAIEQIWVSNEKGVYKLVHTFFKWFKASDYYPFEDAKADAACEFIRFVTQKYDPDRGYKVMTGATAWIQKTLRVKSGRYRTIELKGAADWKYIAIAKTIQKYEEDLSLKDIDLIEFIQLENPTLKRADILALINLHNGVSSFDFEFNQGEKTYRIADAIPNDNPSDNVDNFIIKDTVNELMSKLDDTERELINIKFGLGFTDYDDIDDYIQKTGEDKQSIKKIINSAMKKLRKATIKQGVQLCEIL